MPALTKTISKSGLPAYALYGESSQQGLADRLHVESIARRSRLHDWEIKPHRHESLFQIVVIRKGKVEAWFEGRLETLRGPCVVTVPAMAAHGFRFSRNIDGSVFTTDEPHLVHLLAGNEGLRQAVQQLRAMALPAPGVVDAAEMLRREFQAHERWRPLAIDLALLRLMVEVGRVVPGAAAAGQMPGHAAPEHAVAHVQRLRVLVESGFRQQPALSALALQIGITSTQLNRVCHRVLGHSALGVLHARVLLEAQRDLAYTGMSVKQVAHGLGFGDAGYFTRFFQRHTGLTPSAWRSAAARRHEPGMLHTPSQPERA